MENKKTWDDKFLSISREVGTWSKDRSTKLGAVIVDKNNVIISVGYNGFPRNIDDDIEERHQRPEKYKWTEHAERNAIYNLARRYLEGTKIYLPWIPCVDCARAIIQTGISEIITDNIVVPERWKDNFKTSIMMLEEAGVIIRLINSDKKLLLNDIIKDEESNEK